MSTNEWRPTPLREFVLKVRQRCNLACSYCYVYEMPDQTWRSKPPAMSAPVLAAAAERIAEHVERHHLDEVAVVLHGGEPLLMPVEEIAWAVTTIRGAVPVRTNVRMTVQTNGVAITRTVLLGLLQHGVRVGVSIDGSRTTHDRMRRHARGTGTYDQVRRGLALLGAEEFHPIYAGLLCVVDPHSDPIDTYESLRSFRPPVIDFLLPHANWSTAPRADVPPTAYGDWLACVFDRWYWDGGQPPMRVRLFEEIIKLLLGGASSSEQVGLSPAAVAVIETDGTVEQADSLKSAYAGAAATGLSVFNDSLDRALEHPGFIARQIGISALSDTCLACDVVRVCGGGMYAHRYRAGTGFRNPSRYCADLQALIDHIRSRVVASLTAMK